MSQTRPCEAQKRTNEKQNYVICMHQMAILMTGSVATGDTHSEMLMLKTCT